MRLYLSQLSLSRAPSIAAFKALLSPADGGARLDAHHKLLWSAFADHPDRQRDFLWREDNGVFTVLSQRPPGQSPVFEEPKTKEFAPELTPGDRLQFQLRVNATRTVKSKDLSPNGKPKRQHVDVTMDALLAITSDRAAQRMPLAQKAGADWFESQGQRHGFRVEACHVTDYSVLALPGYRGPRKGQPQFGILDMTGAVIVVEPETFLTKLSQGFGRAKAFGCGLMLIRRA